MARADFTHIHTMKTAGNRLRHSSLLKGSVVTQLVNLTLIHRAILRKTAVYRCAITDHMLTVMHHAVSTGLTGSAVAVRIDADTISCLIICHLRTNLCDYT